MTHTDLKPCPWCQKADRVRTFELSGASFGVVCHQCGVQFDCRAPTPEEAITAWNTRARTPDTAPSQSGDQTAWLVEMPSPVDGSPQWFCAGRGGWNWIKDAHTAIWFVRKRDAEQFADWACLSGWPNARVTEHMWVEVETARRALGGSNET